MKSGNIVALGVVTAGLLALSLFSPTSEAWPLQCPLFKFTGWQCPLCGSQRAIHELLHGHIVQAWHYNPGLWLATPYLTLWSVGTMIPKWNKYRIVAWTSKGWALGTMIGMLLLWGVLRNLI